MKASTCGLALLCGAALASVAEAQGVRFKPEIIESTPESRARLKQNMEIADLRVRGYLRRSTESVQQGHRDGFARFRTWYRSWDARQKEHDASRELLQKMFMTLVGPALNVFIPGSGPFIETLRGTVSLAIDETSKRLGTVDRGDVNRFLDEHHERVEGVITSLLDVPDNFRKAHRAEFDAARTEYVFEILDEAPVQEDELPPATRRLLASAGVPEPGSPTAFQVRDELLAAQIYGVLSQSEAHRIIHSDWEIRTISKVEALKHLYPKESARYCPIERKLHDFFRTPECRSWKPSA